MTPDKLRECREALLPCPFCGNAPYFELGKRGNCQLHGEPFQSIIIRCKKSDCPAKPLIAAGDIFNGGEAKAKKEAAKLWNTRADSASIKAFADEVCAELEKILEITGYPERYHAGVARCISIVRRLSGEKR
jgi:hypothetical protein